MAGKVPTKAVLAVFLNEKGQIRGVFQPDPPGTPLPDTWVRVKKHDLFDTGRPDSRIPYHRELSFMNVNNTAPDADDPDDPDDSLVPAGPSPIAGTKCYYVIQGGRAYRVCV